MNNICYNRPYVYYIVPHEEINGIETFDDTIISYKWQFGIPVQKEDYVSNNFNAVYYDGILHNASCNTTLFRKAPFIRFYDKYYNYYKITKNKFKTYTLRNEVVKVNTYTIDDLMKRLSADDFIAYCKYNDVTICSTNKN